MGMRRVRWVVAAAVVLLFFAHGRAIDRLPSGTRAALDRAASTEPARRAAPARAPRAIGFADLAGDALFGGRDGPARHVELAGFALPLAQDDQGRLVTLLLTAGAFDCCYGRVPEPDAWVLVRVSEGAPREAALVVSGWLERAPEYDEAGRLVGLYRLVATSVRAASAARSR